MKKIVLLVVFYLLLNNLTIKADECFYYKIGFKMNEFVYNLDKEGVLGPDGDFLFTLKFYDNRTNPRVYFNSKLVTLAIYDKDIASRINHTRSTPYDFVWQFFSSEDISPQHLGIEFLFEGCEDDKYPKEHNCYSCTAGNSDDGCVSETDIFNSTPNTNVIDLLSNNPDYQNLVDFSKYKYLINKHNQINLTNTDCGSYYSYKLDYDINYQVFSPSLFAKHTSSNVDVYNESIHNYEIELCGSDNFTISSERYNNNKFLSESVYNYNNLNVNPDILYFNENNTGKLNGLFRGNNSWDNKTYLSYKVNNGNVTDILMPDTKSGLVITPAYSGIINSNNYTLYDYKITSYFNNNTNCPSKSIGNIKFKVYPPITNATLEVNQPCASDINEKGKLDVSSVNGGKLNAYQYTLTGSSFANYQNIEEATEWGETLSGFETSNYNSSDAEGQAGFLADLYQDGKLTNNIQPITNQTGIFNNLNYGTYHLQIKSTLLGDCVLDKYFCIYPMPNPIITLDNQAILCTSSNNSFEFNATANRIVKWLWAVSAEDPTVSTSNYFLGGVAGYTNPSLTPIQPNDYIDESSNKVTLAQNNRIGCMYIVATDKHGCIGTTQIEVPNFTPPTYDTKKIENVLDISASRLEGIWLNDFRDISMPSNSNNLLEDYSYLLKKNEYESGQAGLYRTVSTYSYLSDRLKIGGYNLNNNFDKLSGDGVYSDANVMEAVPLFNWSNPRFELDKPKWIKGGEITGYSTTTEEVENKDILGIYSSALYSYRNTLPIAVASNAEKGEIAFESFEEYTNQENVTNPILINEITNATGNFDIINKVAGIPLKKYDKYNITNASGRYAITDMDPDNLPYTDAQFAQLTLKVLAKAPAVGTNLYEENLVTTKGKLLINTCDENNNNQSQYYGQLVQFEYGIPGFNSKAEICNRFWTGNLYIEREQTIDPKMPFTNVMFTDKEAHTGNISVKIDAGYAEMEQYALELTPGREYLISGWIKTANSYVMSPADLKTYCNEKNIGLKIKGKGSSVINSNSDGCDILITPTGPIINGWQKIEGKFRYPTRSEGLLLSFNNTATFYMDDIRLFPYKGNIQTYVYDPVTLRQEAILDQNNFATIYKYDEEGKLFQIKKETEEGIKTIQVTQSFMQRNK